jgi:hypothetical protein
MNVIDKAIKTYGFENPITITIAVLEEQGRTDLAERLYNECLALGCEDWNEEDPWDEDEEYLNDDDGNLKEGLDLYAGCYSDDC